MSRSEGLIQIRLTELQIEMQRLTAQYQTYTASVLSIMIAIDVLLFAVAVVTEEIVWPVAAFGVTILCVLFVNLYFEHCFLSKVDDLRQQIRELKKQHNWQHF